MSQISRFITGANSLDISADTGTGSPQNDQLNILGGTNITTSISNNTLTIDSSGGVTSPSFEGDGGGTASPDSGVLQMAGGLNLTSSAANDTVTYDMDQTLTSLNIIRYNTGGSLETDQSAGNTYTLDAYDTNVASYTSFLTLTAGNPPTADLNVSTTIGGNQIYYASGPDVALADGGTGIDASGATDGQLLIGGTTSNDLQLNTLTAGSNISITNGTNSITIAADATGATTFQTDGSDATVSSNTITMAGGSNITTSGAGSTVTYDLDDTVNINNLELAETDSTGSVGVISMQNSSSAALERILHAGDNGASGLSNIFVGSLAGSFSTSSVNNVGVGKDALTSLGSGGFSNTAIGFESLRSATTPEHNTAVGINSGHDLDSGESNVFVGSAAGFSALDNWNIIIGRDAGINLTNGSSNLLLSNDGVNNESNTIRIGTQGTGNAQQDRAFIAGIQGVTPSGINEAMIIDNNGQLGSEAQLALARGGTGIDASGATDGQLLIGGTTNNDLQLNTLTGGNNISVTNGNNSITIAVDGSVADTFSADSGSATPSSGVITLQGGTDITTSASGSTVTIDASGGSGGTISPDVIELPETDDDPITQGVIRMYNSTINAHERILHANDGSAGSGLNNIFVGPRAGNTAMSTSNPNGESTGVGPDALSSLTADISTSNRNSAFGAFALTSLQNGQENTALGASALRLADDALSNTACGKSALGSNSNGDRNTAVGHEALSNSTYSNNVGIGHQAGSAISDFDSNNIFIANDGQSGDNGVIRIGTEGVSGQSETHIAGIHNTEPSLLGLQSVVINADNQLGTNSKLIGDYRTSAGVSMKVGQGYIADNGSSTAVFTLPSSPGVGDVVEVVGRDSGGWQIDQNSGDTIHQGANATTTGTGGSLSSSNQWTAVKLMHVGSGDWLIIANDGSGAITFA